jgi:hypothetical protein
MRRLIDKEQSQIQGTVDNGRWENGTGALQLRSTMAAYASSFAVRTINYEEDCKR